MSLAHGLGGRSDLPVPLWLALYAGAAAVVVSFFALTVLWKEPRLRGADAGRALPLRLQRFIDSAFLRVTSRVLGVVLFGGFLAMAWTGPAGSADNPAPAWFYVWFWVGLVPLSLVFGPVWRRLNPLRTIASLIPLRRRELPPRWGYLPAIVGLLAFLWLELVYPHSDSPRAIALFATVYAVIHIAFGVVFGPRWFDRGDAFEIYASLIAGLSPFGRRADGRLVLRNPLDGLLALSPAPWLTALVLVVLGSTAFDGLTRLPFWTSLDAGVLGGTAGLAACIALTYGAYAGAISLTRPYLRRGFDPYPAFAPSLIPIMVGYTVAHYFSFAVFSGQQGFGRAIDYTVVSTGVIALVQIAGIVAGHVLAVTSAHDRSVGVLRANYVKVGQYPMLALMIGYTALGIALVSGS
ncbi:hypothetical protein [Amycolatopsis regifaucium]|uniref:Fenitrothion hydrolase n=1 Tax=Amycolatopsis regifaucium TaxID=546365 RepID=A0A154MUU9_9PSEU|nr:hypothetical protein [Amycolatopsis regifaucium]KZB88052.1 hypothetical protein AVL48_18940 [Amycolatopsis regifaucium]OKA04445.1 hypothetical protein ATP06_0231565 [Amycolatopsis regifaucium]SFH49297.1 hypothetical protein SAMN04489731_104455 [Amycolatopsis regifaucium]